jgi:amidase
MKYHWGALSPLLDLTTGVFPVTQVDLEKDVVPADWKAISEMDKKVMDYCKTSSPSLDSNSGVL